MYFNLFPTTIITKGQQSGLIFNLKISTYFKIPLALCDFINDLEQNSIEKSMLEIENEDVIDKLSGFIYWLTENKFGIRSEFKIPFTKINPQYFSNKTISNSILEVDFALDSYRNNIDEILTQLNNLGCEAIEVRIINKSSKREIQVLLAKIEQFDFTSIDLMIEDFLDEIEIKELCGEYLSVKRLIIFNSSKTQQIELGKLQCVAFYSDKNIPLSKSCGTISNDFFYTNQRQYIESIHHNTCLNGKISIGANGEIMNCPSMKANFGNIRDIKLEDAINIREFRKYWNVTKEQIAICKDCEFRDICTDCRAFTENPKDVYSKPLKCGYDPYTGTW
jgi:SPASM domain peptide maturase of grasp-with-spasm system